jgi:hypothetical protein
MEDQAAADRKSERERIGNACARDRKRDKAKEKSTGKIAACSREIKSLATCDGREKSTAHARTRESAPESCSHGSRTQARSAGKINRRTAAGKIGGKNTNLKTTSPICGTKQDGKMKSSTRNTNSTYGQKETIFSFNFK